MEQYAFHTLCYCWYCFTDIYLSGCNDSDNNNHSDDVDETGIYFTDEMKGTNVVVGCILVWFLFPLGVVWLLLPSWLEMNQ